MAVFAQVVLGKVKKFALGDLGLHFERPIIESGIDRWDELDPGARGGREVEYMGEGETFSLPISAGDLFIPEEVERLSEAFGVDCALPVVANGTADALLGDDMFVEAKLRQYKGEMIGRKQVYVKTLPGAGNVYYGDELSREVLPGEYDQNQWNLRATGRSCALHVSQFGMQAGKTAVFLVPRDDARIRELEIAVLEFTWKHLSPFWQHGLTTPPALDESEYSRLLLNEFMASDKKSIEMTSEMRAKAWQHIKLRAEKKAVDCAFELHKNQLIGMLKGSQSASCSDIKVNYRGNRLTVKEIVND